jgi:serine/threonine protein kinase
VLYTMVCGVLPFSDPDKIKLYKKILSGVYKPIKSTSNELKDLIEKILVVNPKDRLNIKEIKSHPWWNLVPYGPSYGLYKEQKISYD